MVRKSAVDLYIGRDCHVREIYCKSIVDPTADASRVSLHASSDLDYTQPNDFRCWHCAAPFDTPPIPLPVSYDPRERAFQVEGNMCSWACAKTYLATHGGFGCSHRLLLLKQVALCHYGQQLNAIVGAPPHTALRAFGGNMSIEEFRASDVRVQVLSPPFVSQRCIVKEQHGDDTLVGWSVYGLRRPPPTRPSVVAGSERGLYFDFVKQQEQRDAAPPAPSAASSSAPEPRGGGGGLDQFLA